MNTPDSVADPLRISLILPVYNVADYLPECLQSIIDQSVELEIEAFLVEDCSTDHSLQICTDFSDRYPGLFKLIANTHNQGVSVARNIGLDNAKGEYFMFVDPDDVLPSTALHSLYSAAVQYDADMIKGNNTIFNQSGEKNARYNVSSESLIRGEQVLTTLYNHSWVRGHPWGKLFNRSRLGHVRFPLGVRMAEDLYYCAEVFSNASSLLLIDQPVYRYRNRDTGSTGRMFNTGAYLDWLDSVEKVGKFASSREQVNAHRGLLLRTLAQIARECRKLDADTVRSVLQVIEQKCEGWNIRLFDLIFVDKLPLHNIGRYLKLRMALRQIRRKLTSRP